MLEKLRRWRRTLNWISSLHEQAGTLDLPTKSSDKHTKVLVGRLLSQMNAERTAVELRDVEFQVFSQFGDDGIIQYLISKLEIADTRFVEFGVENYTEANTRFLLIKDKWSGLVIDGNPDHVDYIRRDLVSAFYDLHAVESFITAENIDALITNAGFGGRVGLLSIDIDGMDYWVWEAITAVDAAIVVVEYNALLGPERSIVVPYKADFVRERAHASRLYWGASLAAFQNLATAKGYQFVGCNGNGNNAYFVRKDLAQRPAIGALRPAFQAASFAEYEFEGRRLRGEEALSVIRGLPVFNTKTGQTEAI
jgi:hypothetical protein